MNTSNDSFIDYYKILGVEPDASLEQIRQAYRKAAMKHHPDRGGSNADMVRVNEAWTILSDEVERAAYDRVRTPETTIGAQEEWTKHTRESRRTASEYPRKWGDFEKWMEGFVADVHAAKYGSEKVWLGFSMPTIERSHSGVLFICAGIALVLVLGFLIGLYPAILRNWFGVGSPRVYTTPFLDGKIFQPGHPFDLGEALGDCLDVMVKRAGNPFHRFILGVGPLLLGAWLGQIAHKALQRKLPHRPPSEPSSGSSALSTEQPASPQRQVLVCDKCGRKLRVPVLDKELVVTCPSCKYKFTYSQPDS